LAFVVVELNISVIIEGEGGGKSTFFKYYKIKAKKYQVKDTFSRMEFNAALQLVQNGIWAFEKTGWQTLFRFLRTRDNFGTFSSAINPVFRRGMFI